MLTGIVDLSHWEADMGLRDRVPGPKAANIDAAVRANKGDEHDLIAVLAKTGQGIDAPDPSFALFRDAALRNNLLFGDYHFLTSKHSGAEQARDYMKRWHPDAIHVLDVEVNPNDRSNTVTRKHVEECAVAIHDATGRWPVLYTYPSFPKSLGITSDTVLLNCPFWLASYGERPTKAPSPFRTIDMWQYSDVKYGPRDQVKFPRATPGLGRKVDRSAFDGDLVALREWWANCGRDARGPACRP